MTFANPALKTLIIFAALTVALSACAQTPEAVATPDPALDNATLPEELTGQRRVAALTCVVEELAVIQTDEQQGELMAWSPAANVLALVSPVNRHYAWYVGQLVLYDPVQKAEVYSGNDETVFGDLTWSPDGGRIAYVLLNQEAKRYTIKTIDPANSAEVLVFGDMDAAKTDNFASLKGILAWPDASRLQVISNCGVDCARPYDFDPLVLTLTAQTEIRQNENLSLVPTLETDSPNGDWRVTVDEKGNTWLTSTVRNEVVLLRAGEVVAEIKFSADSRYLSMRLFDRIVVHELGCASD